MSSLGPEVAVLWHCLFWLAEAGELPFPDSKTLKAVPWASGMG